MGLNGPNYNKHLRSDNIFGIYSSFLTFLLLISKSNYFSLKNVVPLLAVQLR